ncbi:hypothetical protein BWI97_12555 [Siphonobacter sp. BAB-5405]|nr:hypothetical protein BWI97_12555 [Siphonobacter sp. BAB-5405]
MERADNHRLDYWLNALIHAHEGRVRVYHTLVTRVNCLLVKPFLMRGMTSSSLCKTQLVNQLWNYGGRMSYDVVSAPQWNDVLDHDNYEQDLRKKVDDNLLMLYRNALREDLPESVRQLLTSQWKLLKSFTNRLAELEPEPTNHYLMRA